MLNEMLRRISHNDKGIFPREELLELIERREESITLLLAAVEEVIGDPEAYIRDASRIDFIYALYLLAQFREPRLYTLLLSFMGDGELEAGEVLGDLLTEASGRMLASVYPGDALSLQSLLALIENEKLDEFVRGQGLHAMTILAIHGRLERDWTVDYMTRLLDAASADAPIFNAHLVVGLADLHAEEAVDSIRRAYAGRLVDSMMIAPEDVDRMLAGTREASLRSRRDEGQYGFIDDTIRELQGWACFGQEDRLAVPANPASPDPVVRLPNSPSRPVKAAKIGRNDPCSCGSGKKFKKCCAG